ncbi:glycosyltransferase [Actinoplanes xinjiangensis]|uniref:Sterol 3beta-glucosyltransferase n=1 Tax=Actinoplanes xinjiangensis TaxID=512350 RepID=A0A316F6D0_9ACTN|nr:glycosyltransferase [Actinoplanes xinjiangensis]PWK40561.1 sterol 3beta-glucosyltransferase [Actinoplanes xinjiangensis]GIF42220.1 glycosyl transferase family 1 [Actinoplanes xinjiangensis]
MKVLVLTLGTRGDVQPFVALAQHLRRRGHEVVVAAPHRFTELVAGHGVMFAGLDDGPLRLFDDATVVGDVATGGIGARLTLMRRMPAMFTRVLEDCWQVASTGAGAGADLIVHNGQVLAGQHVAERLGVPAVLALPMPMYVPTREFAWPGQQLPSWLPASVNRLTYAGMKGPALMFGRTVDRWRSGLGLPRRRGRHDPLRRPDGTLAPVLHAVSPAVIPRPADWPATAQVTGYWFVDTAAAGGVVPVTDRYPAGGDGPPVVFVGFGSMIGPDPEAATEVVVRALRMAGVRGMLAGGWGGLQEIPAPDVFLPGDVPHETVFPRSAVIVHHGGAGTTAAAVRSGRPQVVCPFVGDQPFWAARMQRLGVAAEPIGQRHLTAPRLAAAIRRAVDDPAMITAARRLGEQVRCENGVATAVDMLERLAGGDR